MSSFNAQLADVPTDQLMRELAHRLECTQKPEKRLILIGTLQGFLMMGPTMTTLITQSSTSLYFADL